MLLVKLVNSILLFHPIEKSIEKRINKNIMNETQ